MTDEEPPPPRGLLGVGFWIAVAFGVLCLLAALAVWRLGPSLWPVL